MAPKRKAGGGKAVSKAAAAKGSGQKEGKEEVLDAVIPVDGKAEEIVAENPPTSKKAKVEEAGEKKKVGAKAGRKSTATKVADAKGSTGTPGKAKSAATSKKVVERVEDTAKGIKTKSIIIEASKECQCFKQRAVKVEEGLKKFVPGIEVQINPEKPRRGCFEIRDGEGTILLSLQNLPRPFKKLKELDLDQTVVEISDKLK
eukprot:c20692_g1_i1 orf=224-829(+)